MTQTPENILPCMEIAEFTLKFDQVDAAMKIMMKHAMANSDTPVCLPNRRLRRKLRGLRQNGQCKIIYSKARCTKGLFSSNTWN
ncbi:MAG: hypothetical protein CM1200mP35_09020 [Chloroflexota bacterium]|nr:MAG: hypothetical protein CM1200mP35_09020 [Chloroflexota bacterium]